MPRKRTDDAASAVEERVDRLYAEPLSSFVTARNALASELRRTDPEASARVKGLARPSITAWAINQVYWHARPDYDRLLAAGDEMRQLQRQVLAGRGADTREAAQARQQAVRQVTDRAAAFLADAGHPPSDTVRQRLAVTADAIAAFGSQPAGFTHGRLERELEPPGFEALASLGAPSLRLVKSARPAGTPPPAPRPGGARQDREESRAAHDKRREAEEREARQALGQALTQAERELRTQTERAARAGRDLQTKETRAREARTRRERAERELEQARAAEEAAERDLQHARADTDAAEAARAAAAEAEERARKAFEALPRRT